MPAAELVDSTFVLLRVLTLRGELLNHACIGSGYMNVTTLIES